MKKLLLIILSFSLLSLGCTQRIDQSLKLKEEFYNSLGISSAIANINQAIVDPTTNIEKTNRELQSLIKGFGSYASTLHSQSDMPSVNSSMDEVTAEYKKAVTIKYGWGESISSESVSIWLDALKARGGLLSSRDLHVTIVEAVNKHLGYVEKQAYTKWPADVPGVGVPLTVVPDWAWEEGKKIMWQHIRTWLEEQHKKVITAKELATKINEYQRLKQRLEERKAALEKIQSYKEGWQVSKVASNLYSIQGHGLGYGEGAGTLSGVWHYDTSKGEAKPIDEGAKGLASLLKQ